MISTEGVCWGRLENLSLCLRHNLVSDKVLKEMLMTMFDFGGGVGSVPLCLSFCAEKKEGRRICSLEKPQNLN